MTTYQISRPSKTFVAEPVAELSQLELFDSGYPISANQYPMIRYMGSKYRLLPWIYSVLSKLSFDSALDAFSGSCCVAYLLKGMGKETHTNDLLNMSATISTALIENNTQTVSEADVELLLTYDSRHKRFIQKTYSGIFFDPEDLAFLDQIWWQIRKLKSQYKKAIALSALIRSCAKRQPRGVFTISGNLDHYKDGRRDLRLSIREHFLEQIHVYNQAVFDNGRENGANQGTIFDYTSSACDLVYLDPPYVPRADDNCYIKRYHFLEGLSCYWENRKIMENTKVRKLEKLYTPFSYRHTAHEAFLQMFDKFKESTIVLSYSSNAYPDLAELVAMLEQFKPSVHVYTRQHRYHFGTHQAVKRAVVDEYLIVGE